MDYLFTDEQQQFRKEVREFLEEELQNGTYDRREEAYQEGYSPEFSRKLAAKGWIGISWPREYGGADRGHVESMILEEELLRYGAPTLYHHNGANLVGPGLIAFGSEELKREFLPRILRAEVSFCLGYSEPNAGSDLASLETKAMESGETYIVNGNKTWTSFADKSDYCWLLARTDPQTSKHRGLSVLLVDMKLPGVSVRSLIDITGDKHFNEVFFEDVAVPNKMLVGEKNRGWYQIALNLQLQRGGLARVMGNYPLLVDLVKYARETMQNGQPLIKEPLIRNMLANLVIEFQAGRLLCYRVAMLLDAGESASCESSVAKVFGSEVSQRVADVATRVLALHGQLMPGSPGAHLQGRAARNFLYSLSFTLGGGTSEIQRSIIATRGLGLPRG